MRGPKFCFVHAADLHLDTPFAAIGRVAPEIAGRLRDASLEAFDALIELAIEREAAFVVLAGDIYNSADRGVRAQLRFAGGVERLGARGIPVFVAHGNHDPLDGWSAIRRAPANLIIFGGDEVEAYPVVRDSEPLAYVYGISYAQRDITENLALRFRRQPAAGLHIGVLHCNAGSQPEHAAYSPCSIVDLVAAGLDYWALGHIHRRQWLWEGNPWIVYPGCVQGGKSSDLGARGAVLVEARGTQVERVDFVELDRVRFAHAEIDITGESDLPGLRKSILAAIKVERDTVLTVTLTGRGALHHDLRRPGAVGDVLRDVRDELGIASPFIWVDRIADRTRAPLDREAIGRRGDFSADLIGLVDRLRADPEGLAGLLAGLSLPAGADAGDLEDGEALLREAEERALDLLESEQQR